MPPALSRAGAMLRVRRAPDALVLAVFAASLFVSALLLFAVQPLFARMVLPRLGGSPAVWSVAMCFFQAALLAGYAYAHGLMRLATPGAAVLVHMSVLMLALLMLPLGIAQGWGHPPQEGQHLWVLGLFAVSIGLPFFALAANAPLLQAWFARTGHPHAGDPYFLYGASNLGSLLALLAYPVLIEPGLALAAQASLWSAGYHAMILFIVASAALMLLQNPSIAGQRSAPDAATLPRQVRTADRLAWTALAFVPSGLLVAVTSHISTDVAAAPFLWVVPLALYLVTFIVTFQRRPVLPHWFMLALQPALVALLVITMQLPFAGAWSLYLIVHLAAFFVAAMVCHGEMVRRRPAAGALTEFYLCMALGGALGGLFAGLLAPHLFSTVVEYPLLVVLALLARPGLWPFRRSALARAGLWGALVFALAAGPKLLFGVELIQAHPDLYVLVVMVVCALIILSRPDTARLASVVAAALLAGYVLMPETVKGESLRSFFGVNRVVDTPDGKFRLLMHGTTLHGAQRIETGGVPPEPLTYYHGASPFAEVIGMLQRQDRLDSAAVVGLGTGSLACYRRPGERWTFFEIDAAVVRIATDPDRFTFLSHCAPDLRIVVGDARLTLAQEAAGAHDLIVLDAFSSDAIPVHLLTLEAMRLYLDKLGEDGLIALHISNRNMDLTPIAAAAAQRLGLAGLVRTTAGSGARDYISAVTVAVLAREPSALAGLEDAGWLPLPRATVPAWTDDYSNVLAAILSGFRP